MKKSGLCFRVLSCALALMILTLPVFASDGAGIDMSVVNGCHSIDAQVPMLDPIGDLTNLTAAILYDYTNDTLLYSANPDLKQSPASLVKIMTGLIIAERGNMDEMITVREDVLATLSSDSMVIFLKSGEIISMHDLLFCTIVGSANEAAAVAADHICGSQEEFIKEMNRYAQELGCTNTNFTNVHGLHDDNQYTTARDMARILSVAVKNEIFMEAFSTVRYQVPATNLTEPRYLNSNNHFMTDEMTPDYLDKRVSGARSGTTNAGLRNLAVTAESNNISLISIVLGSELDRNEDGQIITYSGAYKETRTLLDLGFKGYDSVQLFYKGQVVHQYPVVNGDSYVTTGVMDSYLTLIPDGFSNENLSFQFNEQNTVLHAPIKAGDFISTVQVWCSDICLAQVDLFALHDVGVQQTIGTQTEYAESPSGFSNVLVVILVIIILLLVLLFGRRVIINAIRKQRIRRHRKNRRRSR